ncbi:hypothetical protein [Streptomyces sp. NPDC058157]|uniref:hypothetical protein n=1 Tax=Streptomyces sp. NPDC058157 TaxID=3346360 RepID=UPI0036E77351
MTDTTSEEHEPTGQPESTAGPTPEAGAEGQAGQDGPDESLAQESQESQGPDAGQDGEDAQEGREAPGGGGSGDGADAADGAGPAAGAAEDPPDGAEPEGGPLRRRVTGKLRTLALAAGGVVLSAAVAAVVSAYLDIWSVREPPPGAPRITAASEVWWDLLSDHHLVRSAPGSAYEKEPLPDDDAQDTLARMVTAGGVDAGTMRIRLILSNFTRTPATITSLRARIESTRPAPTGPLYHCGGPQGTAEVSRVTLDLAVPQRPAAETNAEGKQVQYPSDKLQVAAQGEPAYFDVQVFAGVAEGPAALAYEFVLDVGYTQGDRQEHLIVDKAGRPFALAQGTNDWGQGFRCQGKAWSAR